MYFKRSYSDVAVNWQLNFQDPATPIAEGMLLFHNYLMAFLITIGVFVCYFIYEIVSRFSEVHHPKIENFTHCSLLESLWTTVPGVILVLISIPSFALLYSLDELIEPTLTLKIIGHQWYWGYEYSLPEFYTGLSHEITFDSYMIPVDSLPVGGFRLLEVDNRVCLPVDTHIRLLVTSADVLHSWTVPSFGIKIDACPGRLSQGSLLIKREGVFYGQCSEICGVNHGFMPIVIKAVSFDSFLFWFLGRFCDCDVVDPDFIDSQSE